MLVWFFVTMIMIEGREKCSYFYLGVDLQAMKMQDMENQKLRNVKIVETAC